MQKYAFASLMGFVSILFTLTPLAIASAETFPQLVSVATDGTQANDSVRNSAIISPDGRHVVFDSRATNLASGTTTVPGRFNVFAHDIVSGTTTPLSVATNGTQG